MKILFLTAGAAGMYCGSCMHDNALARALNQIGVDCLLQPLYTPIRTDEPSVASQQVFFGGVNIYLTQQLPLFRYVPAAFKRWLDRPGFLSWATRRASATDAAMLGELTLSMLRGEDGNQKDEVERLVTWLRRDINPDAIVLTNLLIAGPLPAIRRALPDTKVVAILQGDDAFLDHLPPGIRQQAIELISQRSRECDAILVNSQFYAERMVEMLGLEPERVRVSPLAIDTSPFESLAPQPRGNRPLTIGYFARVSPEKGLHHLVDAFIDLASRSGCEAVHLDIAGWLGGQNQAYFDQQLQKLREAGLEQRVRHLGSPDLAGKLAMLRGIDVLSVPTQHQEPKGLFVLEALAAGVPVVQPAVGAFPEIIEASGGGVLVPPEQPARLADALQQMLLNPDLRARLGAAGRAWVLGERTIQGQAVMLRQLIEQL